MFAVIGLGNPGSRYANTRHNLGYRAVEALAESLRLSGSWKEKGQCSYTRAQIGGEETLLVLPLQFMNLNGEAIRPLLTFYKVPRTSIVVLYDELDLPPGALRVAKGGSAGGHRGVQDVIAQLGGNDFFRIRIGIGHPRNAQPPLPIDVSDYVLAQAQGEEKQTLDEACLRAAEAAKTLVADGLEASQRKFN